MHEKIYKLPFAGAEIEIQVGKFSLLSDSTILISYNDTQIMVHATSSSARDNIDFFPLSCEFQEKLYSVGRIPGGYIKREGRPSEKSTLASRLMDRPIRPLFPDSYRNDLQIVAQVMSIDYSVAAEVIAMIGASCALSLAPEIPFEGPIGAVQVAYIDDEFIINPDEEQMEKSSLSLIVAGTEDAIMMVEAQANILPEEKVLEAIYLGHDKIKEIIRFIKEIQKDQEVVKTEFVPEEIDEELYNFVSDICLERITDVLHNTTTKDEREKYFGELNKELEEKYNDQFDDYEEQASTIAAIVKKLQKKAMRKMIVEEGRRPDGRSAEQIRDISTEINLLRRTHGSGFFQRGLTSAISITTLGAVGDAQRLDGIEIEETKRFMHHYNFPPYSVGETGRIGSPNRRAIGHGALGEKALLGVIPSEDEFPYSIRVVSEVLSSNGSTSQASICAASMSLLSAGVPIKAPVAGIAMGLIKEDSNVVVMSDIQGLEDFLGDMDFKVAGTTEGVTAIQMDIKIAGLDRETLERALRQAREGRLYILNEMSKTITEPAEMSPYAPRVEILWIDPEKIRDVIGTGGKVITKITTENDAKIDITDDGKIVITGANGEAALGARKAIEEIVKEVEVGEIYKDAKIVRITNFGAFVALTEYHEALCHISEMSVKRLEKVEDMFSEGDLIDVKVISKDSDGKVGVSIKALYEEEQKEELKEKIKNISLGDVFTVKILRITKFGAFVELVPGVDALCHISELTIGRLKRVEDVFAVGDEIVVKVINIDGEKIGVSRKALLDKED